MQFGFIMDSVKFSHEWNFHCRCCEIFTTWQFPPIIVFILLCNTYLLCQHTPASYLIHIDKDTKLFDIIWHTHYLRVVPHWNCNTSKSLNYQYRQPIPVATPCLLDLPVKPSLLNPHCQDFLLINLLIWDLALSTITWSWGQEYRHLLLTAPTSLLMQPHQGSSLCTHAHSHRDLQAAHL